MNSSIQRELTIKDLQLCYDLVAVQTDAPQGCDPRFINDLEDLRVKLKRLLEVKKAE